MKLNSFNFFNRPHLILNWLLISFTHQQKGRSFGLSLKALLLLSAIGTSGATALETILPSAHGTISPPPQTKMNWDIDRIENSTIFFSSPDQKSQERLKTSLHELKVLGKLTPQGGNPYFLLSARPCQSCLEDKAIYAVRPQTKKPYAFVHPGKILDPKTKSVLLDSRAFFGKCLAGKEEVYVVFQKEKVDRRRYLQSSVLIAEVTNDSLVETLLERRLPSLQGVLRHVKSKSCREIEGRNRFMVLKPLDLTPRSKATDEEEEETPESDESELSPDITENGETT